MGVLPVYLSISVYHIYAWCGPSERTERGTETPGTGVTEGGEPPCRLWDLSLGPLKQPVL